MKLPDDPKQRMQVFILIGIGAAILLSLLYFMVTTPVIDARRRALDRLETVRHNLDQANAELARMPRYKNERDLVFHQIREISSNHILHPVFGTYILGVRELIERTAAETAFQIEALRQVGIAGMPIKPGEGNEPFFNTYSVQVSGSAPYESLVLFLRRLEEGNPFIAVSGLTVATQPDKPESHAISMTIQWPVWVDENIEPKEEDLDAPALTQQPPTPQP